MKLNMRQILVESCALEGEGHMHRRGGAGHKRAKVCAANRTWPMQDVERERKLGLGQDQRSSKLDMRKQVWEVARQMERAIALKGGHNVS